MKRLLSWLLVVIFLAMSGPVQAAMASSWLVQNQAFLEGRSTRKISRNSGTVQGFLRIRHASVEYAFNQVGQRVVGEQIDASGSTLRRYGYNDRRQLIASTKTGPRGQQTSASYQLDDNDNITKNNGTTFQSNGADQLTAAGSIALSYNSAGQATTVGAQSLTFAYNDQIKSITAPGLNAQYLYDGAGQRVQKTVNGVVQKFLWNGSNIAKEYKADGSVRADYQLGAGAKIDGKWQFYLTDIQGSTLGVTDDTGKVIATWDYSDYGVTTQTSGSTALYQPMLYTHCELDAETGYYHNRARHYAPKFGKFLARDPIASSNLYSYCGGDPISWTDPSGLLFDGPAADNTMERSFSGYQFDINKTGFPSNFSAMESQIVIVGVGAAATMLFIDVAGSGVAAASYYTMNRLSNSSGKTPCSQVVTNPSATDAEVARIRQAVQQTGLKTTQHVGVSAPKVIRYVSRLQNGDIPPPVLIEDGVLIDGHHRYVAGLVAGIPVPQQTVTGFLGPGGAKGATSIADIVIDIMDWGHR